MKFLLIIILANHVFSRDYHDQTYDEILQRWNQLQEQYPGYIKLKDNFEPQEDYIKVQCGLNPCKYFYAEITDFSTGYENKPTVLMVGGFHGDERLGPNIITELADALLFNKNLSPFKQYLQDKLILLMPLVNPSGYFKKYREESQENEIHVDINRDFNFDNPDGKCFQSKGSRALANLYKKYIIVAGLTFHGGTNILSWPWGSKNHLVQGQEKSTESPDNTVFNQLGDIMSFISLGNTYQRIPKYLLGSMTDTVYSLEGAYEDWAYGAGWETDVVNNQCINVPSNFYDDLNGNQRTLMFLVEASNRKDPENESYGNTNSTQLSLNTWPPFFYKSQQKIDRDPTLKQGYGHIPRNILLSLALIDMVSPYIIYKQNGISFGGCINVDELTVFQNSVQIDHQLNIPGIWSDSQYVYVLNASTYDNVWVQFSCDAQFLQQHDADPSVRPQSFFLQSRYNSSFQAKALLNKLQLNKTFSFYLDQSHSLSSDFKDKVPKDSLNSNILHVYLLLALMVILGLLLSFVYYKFCQENHSEEQVEMVQTVQFQEQVI